MTFSPLCPRESSLNKTIIKLFSCLSSFSCRLPLKQRRTEGELTEYVANAGVQSDFKVQFHVLFNFIYLILLQILHYVLSLKVVCIKSSGNIGRRSPESGIKCVNKV